MQQQQTQLIELITQTIDDAKGVDITHLDVRGKSPITDSFLICTGTSSRHLVSIAEKVVEVARLQGLSPFGLKGIRESDWIVVDLGSVIIHIMQEQSRQLYELEKLWS